MAISNHNLGSQAFMAVSRVARYYGAGCLQSGRAAYEGEVLGQAAAIEHAAELIPWALPDLDSYIKSLGAGSRGTAGRTLTYPISKNRDVGELHSSSSLPKWKEGGGLNPRRKMLRSAALLVLDLAPKRRVTREMFAEISHYSESREIRPVDPRRSFSDAELMRVVKFQGYKCLCDRSFDEFCTPHGDHWCPHSEGGPTVFYNLVALCFECNSAKKAMHPSEFLIMLINRRIRLAVLGRQKIRRVA